MKRSRIFLGITTALLAIAGVAAAKAHRNPSVTVYYQTLNINNQKTCLAFKATKCTGITPGINCVTANGRFQLYTQKLAVGVGCDVPAQYSQD